MTSELEVLDNNHGTVWQWEGLSLSLFRKQSSEIQENWLWISYRPKCDYSGALTHLEALYSCLMSLIFSSFIYKIDVVTLTLYDGYEFQYSYTNVSSLSP